MSDTHRTIFPVSPFLTCHYAVNVGNHRLGVCDALANVGNDGMGIGNDYVCVYRKLGLKPVGQWRPHTKAMERTLKTCRILLRSDFQAPIFSLSPVAWKTRETAFRLPCLMTFLWISATVLRSRTSSASYPKCPSSVRPTSSIV